jgi:hypothetical protein
LKIFLQSVPKNKQKLSILSPKKQTGYGLIESNETKLIMIGVQEELSENQAHQDWC